MKTYTKLLALLLALVLVFACTACGKKDVSGTVTTDSNASDASDANDTDDTSDTAEAAAPAEETDTAEADTAEDGSAAVAPGSVSGGVYENDFLGIACKLDDTWTFYDEDQILALNNITQDLYEGTDFESYFDENTSYFTDMYAQSEDASKTINIVIESIGVQNATLTEASYVELCLDTLVSALEQAGMENVTANGSSMTFAGAEHATIQISAEYQGVSMYETIVCLKQGLYMSSITSCTWGENTTEDVLANFYAA